MRYVYTYYNSIINGTDGNIDATGWFIFHETYS